MHATHQLERCSIRAATCAWFLVLMACGTSPTAPSTAPAAQARFDGVWQLTFRMTDCGGERHCVLFIGTTRQADLRIARTGSTYAGVVTVFGEPVGVSGEMTPDGELVLSGRKAAAASFDRDIEVKTLRVRLHEGATTGTLEYVVRGLPVSPWVSGEVRHGGDVTEARRVADEGVFDDSQFSGSWSGRFIVRQCSWVAWLWCYPYEEDEVHAFRLALSQTGNAVNGTLTLGPAEVPVSGAVSGGVLELRGESEHVVSGGKEITRLTAWSSRRDQFGRMSGTFAFELEWPGIGDGTRLYSTTYRLVELVSTALVN